MCPRKTFVSPPLRITSRRAQDPNIDDEGSCPPPFNRRQSGATPTGSRQPHHSAQRMMRLPFDGRSLAGRIGEEAVEEAQIFGGGGLIPRLLMHFTQRLGGID